MSWQERTLPIILLTSPTGEFFEAKWARDERSYEKSVQRDKYPLIHGETGYDLAGGADGYDITILFDGENCDIDAAKFFEACKAIGTWWVAHPVHGMIELQLLSIRHVVDPTTSGGCVEVETKWFEPLDPVTFQTMRTMTGAIDAQFAAVSASSAAAFAGAAAGAGFSEIGAIVNAVNIANAAINKIAEVAFYASTNEEAKAIGREQSEAAQAELTDQTDAARADTADFDPEAIAVALNSCITSPLLAAPDAKYVTTAMDAAADSFIADIPTGTNTASAMRAHVAEVALEAVICGACLGTTLGEITTRTQAIASAQALSDMFDKVTDALDAVQDQFDGNVRAERRYYAQTETYQAALTLVAKSIEYLIIRSFDLAIEKRITITRDKTPIQICCEEFGIDGDDRLDDFIEWNQFEGDDVELVPAGREVVLYVEASV